MSCPVLSVYEAPDLLWKTIKCRLIGIKGPSIRERTSQSAGVWLGFSRPEPKAQDELLWSILVRRPSARLSVHTFERLLWNPGPKIFVEPCVKEGLKICKNDRGP